MKQIKSLSFCCKDIFLYIFTHIVPRGDYYKKEYAVKVITNSLVKDTLKKKMLKLLELIPKKKSLYLAQKAMNDRDIDKVMGVFAELGVSPVTISKRHGVKQLMSLYSYLL